MGAIFGAWHQEHDLEKEATEGVQKVSSWWSPDRSEHYHNEIFIGADRLHTTPKMALEEIVHHPAGVHALLDARLDNRDEILSKLQQTVNTTDSQLVLELYLRYGEQCLQHLVGAFTLVIWDERDRQLLLARDHMGVRPLSYYYRDGFFAFGTQRKSITAWPQVDKSADWRHILQSISALGFSRDSTSHTHIRYLPPAHYLKVSADGVTLKRYWQLDLEARVSHVSDAAYVEEFQHHFGNAVACRMEGCEAVGSHLSGGLDSSGITAYAHRLSKKLNTGVTALSYNVARDYEGDMKKVEENLRAYDLLDYLDMHADFVNVKTLIDRTFQQIIAHEAQCCDGISQSNNVNTEYEIQAAAAASGLKVVLSGFPGDELVTSFCRPFYLEYYDRGEYLNYFFKKMHSRHTWKHRVRAFAGATVSRLSEDRAEQVALRYAKWRHDKRKYKGESPFLNKAYFDRPVLREVLQPKYLPMAHLGFPTSLRAYQRNHVCRPHSHRRMESEQLAGLHWKMEYRYPMTDIRLLQYMISIPMEQKISPDMSRRTFRLGMKDYLPDSIRLRDLKTAGSLKPLPPNKEFRQEDMSKLALWDQFKEKESAPFLDPEMVEKWMNGKRSPFGLYPWMVLAQLSYTNKMTF